MSELRKNIYDGITRSDVSTALIMSSRVLMQKKSQIIRTSPQDYY